MIPISDNERRVLIVYLSDLHGRLKERNDLGGYARIAGLIRKIKSEAGPKTDVLAVLGGDAAGKGGLVCQKTKDQACFALLSKLGFDLAVLGNGELKRNLPALRSFITASKTVWTSANVTAKQASSKVPWMESYSFRGKKSGASLRFRSWTVPPTPGEVDFAKVAWKAQLDWTPELIGEWAAQSQKETLVMLTHQELAQDKQMLDELCKAQAKIPVMLKAHNHRYRRKVSGACAPIVEPGPYGHVAALVELRPGKKSGWLLHKQNFIDLSDEIAADPAVAKSVEELYRVYAPDAEKIMARVSSDLNKEQFAQVVAESFKNATKADIAIVNMGAIKEGLVAGDLSQEDLSLVYPYNDQLMGLDWSLKDMEKALCKSVSRKRDRVLDNGSKLVFAGAALLDGGTEDCRLILDRKKARPKLATVNYLIKRSKRWLGEDLSGKAFSYGFEARRAIEIETNRRGKKL